MFLTKYQQGNISNGQGEQVVVHCTMEVLATDDHDKHQNVTDNTANEQDEVEDGDEDENKLIFHLLRSQNALKAGKYFCTTER